MILSIRSTSILGGERGSVCVGYLDLGRSAGRGHQRPSPKASVGRGYRNNPKKSGGSPEAPHSHPTPKIIFVELRAFVTDVQERPNSPSTLSRRSRIVQFHERYAVRISTKNIVLRKKRAHKKCILDVSPYSKRTGVSRTSKV